MRDAVAPLLVSFPREPIHMAPHTRFVMTYVSYLSQLPLLRRLLRRFLLRHLSAFFARFGQPNCDRLFLAGYFFARSATLQSSFFALMHRLLNFLLRFL